MTDVMKQLRDADPARRADLDAVSDGAFLELRRDVTAASPSRGARRPAPATRRRLGRRAVTAVGLATVLTGTGVAYAAVQLFGGTDGEGLTCVREWDRESREGLGLGAAGPWLTGDPYADCTTLLAERGLPPIDDPVAFEHDGQTIVAPSDQVPDDAPRLEGSVALDGAVVELRLSVVDLVDGGRSGCRTVDDGAAWARGELERLDLDDWGVEIDRDPTSRLACSTVSVDVAGRLVAVSASDDPYAALSIPETDAIVDALRAGIAERCVDLAQARAVVDDALAAIDHEDPTTQVVDESAACSRVDAAVGGSIQVMIHGPTAAD
jgi:hypothetical protein